MAYLSVASLRSKLPGNASNLTDDDLQEIIDGWISRLDAVSGGDGLHIENGLSRTIVRIGSIGEGEKALLRRDGYTETESADESIERAEKLLEDYDRLTTSPAEEAAEATLRVLPLPW